MVINWFASYLMSYPRDILRVYGRLFNNANTGLLHKLSSYL